VIGSVALVGAGPGDPGLITVRGAHLVAQADVVVTDRLVAPELLDLARPDAEVVDVGKAPRRGPSQEAINGTLVDRARRGLRVVRLKGGDPFVFGRGGEEALALAMEGIPFEVVPGVTSAVAAPALAGIPVTHRGVAASFAVITATLAGGERNDLRRIASVVDTLVVLMAAGRLEEVCGEIGAGGRDTGEPAAVVASAGTPDQRVVVSTLGTLPERAAGAAIEAPATLVVGPVVGLSAILGWGGRVTDGVSVVSRGQAPAHD
jgi:uroporphyrin-III C-methyltransferase